MFERQVAYYLNKYLGQYVYNVDASALNISILKGDVELKNLQLKPEALNSLNLPITVKSGLLGSLRLKVPWSNLGGAPVVCELEGIYVLAVPNKDAKQSEEEFQAVEQRVKKQKVDAAEQQFIKLWKESLEKKLADSKTASKGKGSKAHKASTLQSFIETVLGNLQLAITNVHVRYEDDTAITGQVFSCGLTLEEVSAYTVDSSGNRAFVTSDALDHLRKSARLSRLAVYFDVASEPYKPEPGAWDKMARSHWNKLFMPGIQSNLDVPGRQFVISPVNGWMRYDRLGEKQRKALPESEASQSAVMSITTVNMHVSEGQFKCVKALLEAISLHNQRAPHLHLRPPARPSGRTAVTRWWQYAAKSSVGQRMSQSMSWKSVRQVCILRRKYIPMYVECLRNGMVGGNKDIQALDKELAIGTIIYFRRLAYLTFEKSKQLETAKVAEPAKGSWLSLSSWTGGQHGHPTVADLDFDNMFSDDDMDQMNTLFQEHRKALEAAAQSASDITVLNFLSVSVEEGSVELSGGDGVQLVKAALENLKLEMTMYPKTLDCKVSVGHVISSSAEDVILTSRPPFGGDENHDKQVFEARYIHLPQDGRADHVLNLVIQPTYITYTSQVKDRIMAFFERNEGGNLGAIGAQAGAVADSMASEVKTAMTNAWVARDTPPLLINLDMEAPRVALPVPSDSEQNKETLVLDFGYFRLQSDLSSSEALPEDEALVYDCLALKGGNVQATLVEGDFTWQRWEAMRSAKSTSYGYPIVDPIEMYCTLQYGRFRHPKLPGLRSKVTIPGLSFHLSPARLARTMKLICNLTGLGQGQAGKEPAWLQEVDYSGDVSMLTWSGISFSNAVWEEHWAAIWYGWLNIMEAQDSYTVIKTVSIFNRHALKVPADMLGGTENVIALSVQSQLSKQVIENDETLVLRFATPNLAATWLWRLHLAKQRMEVLMPRQLVADAGALNGSGEERGSSRDQASRSPSAPDLQAMHSNPEAALREQETKINLAITVDIGEMKMAVSGRTRDKWWPPDEAKPFTPKKREFVNESSLIIMRGQGMRVDFQMSPTHVEIGSSLAAMVVEDELVGHLRQESRYLFLSTPDQPSAFRPPNILPVSPSSNAAGSALSGAHPSVPAHTAAAMPSPDPPHKSDSEDEFYDAEETMSVSSMSVADLSSTASTAPRSSIDLRPMHTLDLGDAAPDAQETSQLALVRFTYIFPFSPLYNGVDAEASLAVDSLFFYCNRPTIASLLGLAGDMAQAASIEAATGIPQTPVEPRVTRTEDGGLVKGIEDRITFRLGLEMKKLDVTLNYEGADVLPLLQAEMQDSTFNLDIMPSGLQLDAAIGNLRARDRSYGKEFMYSNICDLRAEGNINSFIELKYSTHKGGPNESLGGRIPANLDYSCLNAKLNAVDIVFLNRQVMEIQAYAAGLMALQPEPLPNASSRSQPMTSSLTDAGAALSTMFNKGTLSRGENLRNSMDTESQPPGRKPTGKVDSMILLLDIDMQAPVITMPMNSFSLDSIQMDCGHLQLSNCVTWEKHGGHHVLVDVIKVGVSGIQTKSFVDGVRNYSMVRFQKEGFQASIRRTLHGPMGLVPNYAIDILIPEAQVDITDREYRLITAIATSNLNEPLNMPSSAIWIRDELVPKKQGSSTPGALNLLDDKGFEQAEQPLQAMDTINLKVVLEVRKAHLQLLTTKEGSPEGFPLAEMILPCMTVNYQVSQNGMSAAVAIPHVVVHDTRPGTPEKSRIVMCASTSRRMEQGLNQGLSDISPSMVVVEYMTNVHEATATVNMRLQNPTFIAEMGFVLALSSFVGTNSKAARDYINSDILLTSRVTCAAGDLWLSPDCRLLADGGAMDDYEFNGCGYRIFLPPGITQADPLPLILVGSGKSLRLRNCRIVNAASLAGALQLRQGAQLVAEAEDEVFMVEQADFGEALAHRFDSRPTGMMGLRVTDTGAGEDMQRGHVRVNLTAVGMSINFLDVTMTGGTAKSAATDAPMVQSSAQSQPGWVGELSTYMFTISLDIAMTYTINMSGSQELDADLHDVLMEAYLGAQDISAEDSDKGLSTIQPIDFRGDCNTVLQPCDITFHYSSSPTKTEIKLDTSDMLYAIGVDMIHAITRLHKRVLEPISRPPPDRPLATATSFSKVWPTKTPDATGMPPYSNPRAVDLFAAERSFVVWHPNAPSGYVVLGDIITQGGELPRHHSVCLAKDSDLASTPLGYRLVLEELGLWVWEPDPPEGFVSLGCVCTTSADPPDASAVFCVRANLLVEAAPSECLCSRTRTATYLLEDNEHQQQLEQVRLWSVGNSAGTFVAVTGRNDEHAAVPIGKCFDLRAPLGVTPAALHQHMEESARYRKLKPGYLSPNVTRHTVEQGEGGGESYVALSWDTVLQRELAYNFFRNDATLRRQRTRDQASVEVAEFQRLFVYDSGRGGARASFWRPVVPAGYVALGDCMSFDLHPPREVTVFLDNSYGEVFTGTSSKGVDVNGKPSFQPPTAYQKMWEGPVSSGSGQLSLWRPIPPPGYAAVGWIAWRGRTTPQPGNTSVRCISEELVQMLYEVPDEILVWERSTMFISATRGQVDVSLWRTNLYTSTFCGVGPTGSQQLYFVYDSGLINDEFSNGLHASWAEQPHYNVLLDTGLLSIMLLDVTRRPLVEMNLGGADALQGRSASWQRRHGRHIKREGCSAQLLESAPGLLQAVTQLSIEVWSYNANHWEPILEPVGLLVHLHHNTRSKMVKKYRPGTHLSFKITSDTLHITVAHNALDSLLRAMGDASAMMKGDSSGVLQTARQSARYAYVENSLGCPFTTQVDFGNQSVVNTCEAEQTIRLVLPRSMLYKRKRSCPPSIPKAMMLVDVNNLELQLDCSPGGALSVSVAMVPAHELDQHMPVQTRWVRCTSDGSTFKAAWQERLVLCVPDEQVQAIAKGVAEGEPRETDAPMDSITIQIPGEWLVDQVRKGTCQELVQTVPLHSVGSPQDVLWGTIGITARLEWLARLAGTSPESTDADPDVVSTLTHVKVRLNESDMWSPVSHVNTVRRGGADVPGTAPEDGAAVSTPVIVTPVMLLSEDRRKEFAVEEMLEKGLRKFNIRSLCQVANHTSVTLEVGLINGPEREQQSSRSGPNLTPTQSIGRGRPVHTEEVGGDICVSVVERVYENERLQILRGWGARGHLTRQDEIEGHKQYEWLDLQDDWQSDYKWPSMPLPKGWSWLDKWSIHKVPRGDENDGFIYGTHWDELTFPPLPGTEISFGRTLRRRMWTRTRVKVSSSGCGEDDNVRIIGRIPPRGKIPLPLGWNEDPNATVVLRPVSVVSDQVNTQDSALGADFAAAAQMGSIAHNWSICMVVSSAGIPLWNMDEGSTFMMACPPCSSDSGAVQIVTPNKHLKKFTAIQGLVFWMSARVVANPFPSNEDLVDWEVVISPPLLLENLLPIGTEFQMWEMDGGEAGRLKLRCQGALDSGGSVPIHAVDMRQSVYISLKPDGCRSLDDEPVLLYSGGRSGAALPDTFGVSHADHGCRARMSLFLERRTGGQMLNADPKAAESIAHGAPMAVSLYASLVVLNTTQLPVYVDVEKTSRQRRRPDKHKSADAAEKMEHLRMGDDATMIVHETIGCYSANTGCCMFPPGTGQLMSFPMMPEYEYSIKVAMDGSNWAPPEPLDGDVPNSPWLLRAHVCGTQQIHEAVVSITTCTGAFGRSKLLKLEPHIVISNLTGFPIQLLQCIQPSQAVPKAQRRRTFLASNESEKSRGRKELGLDLVNAAGLEGSRASDSSGISRSRETDAKKSKKRGKFHSARRTRKGPDFSTSLNGPQLAGSSDVLDPEITQETEEWPTDDLGTLILPPGSAAVPIYWTESCWRNSLCVRLLDQEDPDNSPTSFPLAVKRPGFEEVQLRLPVSRSCEARLPDHDDPINAFTRNSGSLSATKLRGALAGSPFCRPVGDDMHECYTEDEAMVIRVSATLKRNTCMHLVFHSISTEAPNAIENRSPSCILFRKVGRFGAEWQLAQPWTSVPVAWDSVSRERRKIELSEIGVHMERAAMRYSLASTTSMRKSASSASVDALTVQEEEEGGSQRETTPNVSLKGGDEWAVLPQEASGADRRPLHTSIGACIVHIRGAGATPHPLAGGGVLMGYSIVGAQAVGLCNRAESLIVARPNGTADKGVAYDGSLQHLPSRLYLSFKLPSVDVSVVDHTPQELMLFSADGIELAYSIGLGPQNSFSHLYLKVGSCQVDNMMPYTKYPILLCPVTTKDDVLSSPVFEFICCEEPSRDLGHLYYPYIYTSVGRTIAVHVCEGLVWAILAMYNNLGHPSSVGSDQPANVQADTIVDMRMLIAGDLRTRLSFGTSPEARAKSGMVGSFGYLFTLAAFKDLPFNLDGWDRRNINMPRSIFFANLYSLGMDYLFALAFRILRSNVSLASASRAIGGVSGQVAKLSMDDEFQEIREQNKSGEIKHIGEGFREGGEALAKGLAWGLTGVVRRPWQGAQQKGAAGFFQGLGAGVVGAVTQPMSGMLDLVSKTAEGAGATFDQVAKSITGDEIVLPKERRRLPRVISGDKWLQPFNQQAAEGQILMWKAKQASGLDEMVNMRFRAVKISQARGDKYEAHLKLPGSKFAFITNCRVMMLSTSPSSQGGGKKIKVPLLEWECEWDDLLSPQLKRSRNLSSSDPPDCVVLHRKVGTPQGIMQHECKCHPQSAQAEQLLEMVQQSRVKYCESYRGIRETEPLTPVTSPSQIIITAAIGEAIDNEVRTGLFEWAPGYWRLIWRSYGGTNISIWRPVAPEGYVMLGDVLTDGTTPPQLPVVVMRRQLLPEDASIIRSGGRPLNMDKPAMAHPMSYLLIWRNSGKGRAPKYVASGDSPLSIWWPVAPDGYNALGCVAVPALEEPPLSLVGCPRRDLVQIADLEGSPIWKGMSTDRSSWRCFMWRVHNSASRNFFAARPDSNSSIRQWRVVGDVLPQP